MSSSVQSFTDVQMLLRGLEPAVTELQDADLPGTGWEDYLPTISNMTVGNGGVVARYKQIGNTVYVLFHFVLGTTSSMGTAPVISLPVPLASYYTNHYVLGTTTIRDGTSITYWGQATSTAGDVLLRVGRTDLASLALATITSTVPMTWTSTDQLGAFLIYETDA